MRVSACRSLRRGGVLVAMFALVSGPEDVHAQQQPALRFEIEIAPGVRAEPVTGRVLLMIARDTLVCADRAYAGEPCSGMVRREPRQQGGAWETSVPIFGVDVEQLSTGGSAVIDATTVGYPPETLGDLPSGEYYVQAVLNVYTRFQRADGHTVWLHADQWEGQQFNASPGNLVSPVQRVRLDREQGYTVKLSLSRVLPPVVVPPDDDEVKRIRIQSRLLTEFWGQPMYLGAVVLLPRGYDAHPDVHYPVVYLQGHFSLAPPLGHTHSDSPETPGQRRVRTAHNRETRLELSRAWDGPGFPRMLAVTFQHPTPYYDDSYAVNSANNGPYGNAIMTELIPEIERRFRIIRQPYARVLNGGSTGGWEALALQVQHPEFFGGTWPMYPDPVDFRSYGLLNIYADTNAFVAPHHEWLVPERFWMRDHWQHGDWDGQPTVTMRAMSRLERVLGTRGRSAEQLAVWEAVYGPVGDDGYFKPLFDKTTGTIDRNVAEYMRDHGYDLTEYLRRSWPRIGRHLVGKLHISVGEMDEFYLNNAVYRLEEFLESTKDPYYAGTFSYGRPKKSHGWQPKSTADMLRDMAAHIAKNAPANSVQSWNY
jgi:hypothetical protein